MKKLKSVLRQIALFSLGIVFSACITVLAETINTKINSNKLQANIGEIEDVDAAISGLVTQTNNLETRIAALETLLPKYYDSNSPFLELNERRELTSFGGHLDFHYAGSTADYTSRIIENSVGLLDIQVSRLKINYTSYLTGPGAITPTANTTYGSLSNNRSFKIGTATFLNFQFVIVNSIPANTNTVIATLPEGSRPSATAQCASHTLNGYLYPYCYVNTSGQVIIKPAGALASTQELRITGSFLQ